MPAPLLDGEAEAATTLLDLMTHGIFQKTPYLSSVVS